jgi:hypothetical protein
MLESPFQKFAFYLLGQVENENVPKAPSKSIIDFNSLKALQQPNPKFKDGTLDPIKKNTQKAIYQRLLAVKKGQELVDDLVTLKDEQHFTIQFYIDITYPGGPKNAAGFTDIENGPGILKKNVGIYVNYWQAYDPRTIIDFDEGGFDFKKIKMASSRTSYRLFHELLHVWFHYSKFPDATYPSGHNGDDSPLFDDRFVDRLIQYANELSTLEENMRR